MIQVLVNGCNGKMGQEVICAIQNNEKFEVLCGVDITDTGKYIFPVYTNLKDIKEIKMDLTAQFVQFGLFSDYTFKVTLDCISDEGIYKFTLKNKDDFIDIIQHFHQLEIPLDDPRHIEEAYHQYPHDYERTKYYRRTHKDLLKYK